MSEIVTIADLRNRMRSPRPSAHLLDTETPAQIAGRLEAFGNSARTARNAAETACAVARALREGRMVGTEWGE